MKYIKIKKITDFKKILNSPIYLDRETAQLQEGILKNAWGFGLSDKFLKKITIMDLSQFVSDLIIHRTRQIRDMNLGKNATLYIWFDAMALQIRFNILSGENIELPFGCTLNFVESLNVILQQYIDAEYEDSKNSYYTFDAVRERDSEGNMPDWEYENKDFDEYIQDVWVTTLRCDNQK